MDMILVTHGSAIEESGSVRPIQAGIGRDGLRASTTTRFGVAKAWTPPMGRWRHRRFSHWFARLILVCLWALLGQPVWAAGCTAINGYPKIFNLTLPGSSIMVPRDAAIGTTLAVVNGPMLSAGSSFNTATWFAQCQTASGTLNGVLTSTPWPPAGMGTYSTNVAGVGVQIMRNTLAVPGTQTYVPSDFPVNRPPFGWYWYGKPAFVYTFVKTGPISGGTVTAADVPTFNFNLDGTTTVFNSTASGQITFTTGACTTPDVQVPLDAVPVTAFKGVGSVAGAKSFNIAVNSCPPGLASVMYRLDAASGIAVVNATQGVIGLGSSSSATGVALQITDAGNNPVGFGVLHATTGYNTTSGGSFSVPLKAMYYQTASAMTAGSVVSQAVFTMSYQ